MKLLFLANRIPYPPYRGDKLKIFNLARRLSQRHTLILLCFTETESDKQYEGELKKVFTEVHLVHLPKRQSVMNGISGLWDATPFQVLYFRSPQMQKAVDGLLQKHKFDAVHVQHLRMSPYLENHTELPRILDLPDAFSLYWQRRMEVKSNVFQNVFEGIEQKRVYQYERKILPKYNLALVCSAEDLTYLEKEHSATNLALLPNGVDLTTFPGAPHNYSRDTILLFTGNMDYAPNIDAVSYFKQEILPIIRQRFPAVQFVIAGQRPVQSVLDLKDETTQVTGFVEDMAEMYRSASVVVAPLRFGAGTQNKVLEALAMGVPVVCSNIGFAGLGIESGEGAIMQTDPQQFATSVIELLTSESLRRRVGEAGASIIRSRFDWDVVAKQLEGYFEKVCAAPSK